MPVLHLATHCGYARPLWHARADSQDAKPDGPADPVLGHSIDSDLPHHACRESPPNREGDWGCGATVNERRKAGPSLASHISTSKIDAQGELSRCRQVEH